MSDGTPIRVVVAEDSSVTRALLVAILREEPGFQLVAAVADGDEAVRAVVRHRPSVVAMDLHMPGSNGAEATRRIMQEAPTPIVIVTASSNLDGTLMYDALAAGALSVVPRPLGPSTPTHVQRKRQLIKELRLMSEVRVVRRYTPSATTRARQPRSIPVATRPCAIVAIAASTGGPAALLSMLSGLPHEMTVPIVVVQHIAMGFIDTLADWLGRETGRAVKVGQDGDRLVPNEVVLAPDDQHIRITPAGRVSLSRERPVSGHRPSATVLFDSIADSYGAAGVGVVLTGMGRDGADGLRRLADAGGLTLVQEPATSAVSGMPSAAIDAGSVAYVLGLDEIPAAIASLASAGGRRSAARRAP